MFLWWLCGEATLAWLKINEMNNGMDNGMDNEMDNEEKPVEKDDEYKEMASWKGNTLIDVTGYAFCHCHALGH